MIAAGITATATATGLEVDAADNFTHIETRVASDVASSSISVATTTKGDTLNLEVDGTNFKFGVDSVTNLVSAINNSALGSFITAAADGAGTGIDLTANKAADRYQVNVTATISETGGTAGNGVLNQSTTTESTIVSVSLGREGVFGTATNGAGLITSGGTDLLDDDRTLSQFSIDDFTGFIQNAATARANNGAEMSRLEASLGLLVTNQANLESARSRLMDVDIATESTHFAKHNILVQSSAAMLAQANSVPNVALQLLG